MSLASNHGRRWDVRDKRSKEKVATDQLRQERRAERELDGAKAAVAELEKRLVEAKTAGTAGARAEGGAGGMMKAVVQELAEERRKVGRLDLDLKEKKRARERAEGLVEGVQTTRLEAEEKVVASRAELEHTKHTLEQRRAILGEMIDLQKEVLESRMSRKASEKGASLDTGSPTLSPTTLSELLSLLESQPLEDGKTADAELGSEITHFAKSLRQAIESASSSPSSRSPAQSPQSSPKAVTVLHPAPPHPIAEDEESSRRADELEETKSELSAAMARVEELAKELKDVEAGPRPSPPPPPYSANARSLTVSTSGDMKHRLLKTAKDLNSTIQRLREEQVELLERLCMA